MKSQIINRRVLWIPCGLLLFLLLRLSMTDPIWAAPVQMLVTEPGKAQPMPCEIQLVDENRKPNLPAYLPHWHDHFVCDGKEILNISPGIYHHEAEKYWQKKVSEATCD